MRDRCLDPAANRRHDNFMRILFISAALLAGLIAGYASAGVTSQFQPRTEETTPVAAMRTLISRCVPGIASGTPIVTTGFTRAPGSTEQALLGTRSGAVWSTRNRDVIIVAFSDVPVCRVVAMDIDAAVMADLVIRLFREQGTVFRRQRFRFHKEGGFAAVYTTHGDTAPLVVRLNVIEKPNGRGYATLSVERSLPPAPVAENGSGG